MDLDRLHALAAVAASGSVRAAASNMGYTPSAISQQVSTLSRDLGMPLLERSGRGVVLTGFAEEFLERSRVVLQESANLEAWVRERRRSQQEAIRLGYFSSLGHSWVPQVVRGLRQRHTDITVELVITEDADPATVQSVDLNVFIANPDEPRSDPAAHLIASDAYAVVVPAEHQLAGRDHVRLEELADEAWVDNDVAGRICREVFVDACRAAGFTPCFPVQAQDYATAMSFVAAGLGITAVPGLALTSPPAGVAIVPIEAPTPTRHIMATVRPGHELASEALSHLRRIAAGSAPALTPEHAARRGWN